MSSSGGEKGKGSFLEGVTTLIERGKCRRGSTQACGVKVAALLGKLEKGDFHVEGEKGPHSDERERPVFYWQGVETGRERKTTLTSREFNHFLQFGLPVGARGGGGKHVFSPWVVEYSYLPEGCV